MLKTIVQFFRKSKGMSLADILATETSREELLGMKSVTPPTTEQILDDANRLIAYSHSADYRVWAKEVWSTVLNHLDAIQNPKATTDEIHFHRGALKNSLDLLRVSYRARLIKEQLERDSNDSSAR